MKKNWKKSLESVLTHEGGFSNHRNDPGGATMKGITLGTYRRHYGRDLTVAQLKRIPDAHVETIYRKHYWDKCRCDELPSGVDLMVFDAAVNSGITRSARWLQEVIVVKKDGRIGPITVSAANARSNFQTIKDLESIRLRFLMSLKTWKDFGRGWRTRVITTRETALELI